VLNTVRLARGFSRILPRYRNGNSWRKLADRLPGAVAGGPSAYPCRQGSSDEFIRVRMNQVRVAVRATDRMSLTGVGSVFESRPEVSLVRRNMADVVVFVADRMSASVLAELRHSASALDVPMVLVTDEINETTLLTVVDYHVVAVLPRSAATGDRLVSSVLAAAEGDGILSPEMLGKLLKTVRGLQRDVLAPRGLGPSGLDDREISVLKLLAEGWDTIEIADKLSYSAKTVKNVIFGLTHRLNLRNRTHAVAYALRTGVI
jgi:DNA-binding NarL/FixJ family response regulator